MTLLLQAYNNGDHACLVWLPSDLRPIPHCRGFAIERMRNGQASEFLANHVGFQDEQAAPPAGQEWKWPIQRYLWWDYSVRPGDRVRYRVIPVLGSDADGTLELARHLASAETNELSITAQQGSQISSYFNRGIVAAQWVARELLSEAENQKANRTTLKKVVSRTGNPLRNGLGGALRTAILDMLKQVQDGNGTAFAALYELNDPELLEAITAVGPRFYLILGNGAYKSPHRDENAAIRQQLKERTEIHVFDRLVPSGHFAHNKFLVCCDEQGKAQRALSGSTNWTVSGLCTQANNGIVIDDARVAGAYLEQWRRLRAAGDSFPPQLVKSNSVPNTFAVGGARVTVWFTPTGSMEDMEHARRLIRQAEQGILFLFFDPGEFQDDPHRWTLLQSILHRHHPEASPDYNPRLYIRGVVNQSIPGLAEKSSPPAKRTAPQLGLDPAASAPRVTLISGGDRPPERLAEGVLVPAAIKSKFGHWVPELLGASQVMVHSKVVVIDPFGRHPVVITGSHNLGPKASTKNDDNLVIVEGSSQLAQAYAVNIIAIFQEYRWRHYVAGHGGDSAASWHGLEDNDTWQRGHLTGDSRAELEFWLRRA